MNNSVTLVGNIGDPPEVRLTPHGRKVANVRLAVEERYKASNGEWAKSTDWFTVVAWGRLADIAESLVKGDRLVVAGKLKTRSWDDHGGKRRTVVEVVASSIAVEPAVRGATAGAGVPSQPKGSPPPADDAPDYFDDDVPF